MTFGIHLCLSLHNALNGNASQGYMPKASQSLLLGQFSEGYSTHRSVHALEMKATSMVNPTYSVEPASRKFALSLLGSSAWTPQLLPCSVMSWAARIGNTECQHHRTRVPVRARQRSANTEPGPTVVNPPDTRGACTKEDAHHAMDLDPGYQTSTTQFDGVYK